VLGTTAAAILVVVAIGLIVLPNRSGGGGSSPSKLVRSEISTIDPAALVPQLAELPVGSSVQSNSYVTNAQASQRNQTSLTFLRSSGREIGFDRDFNVPRYGDIDIEVVRFKSHAGMGKAYDYFLSLPGARGLNAVTFAGLGEHAALVTNSQAGFVEFMRGRYYAVITAVPATQNSLRYIHAMARRLDTRILHYGPSA
jgi:hypothetical protein